MAEDSANGAVVARRGVVRGEEGRVQHSRRDEQPVHLLGVVRIDVGGAGGGPLAAVHLLVQLLAILVELAFLCLDVIIGELSLGEALELAPLRPLRRVPHLEHHGVELVLGLVARRGVHPRHRLEVLLERLADFGKHALRLLAVGLREELLHVHLRHVPSHRLLGSVVALLPTDGALLDAVELTEQRLHHLCEVIRGQIRRERRHHRVTQAGLDCEGILVVEGAIRLDIDARDILQASLRLKRLL
mmetsp:Transcript_4070/g.8227  ORF Transcript_4070/g.8227 Transcript_4070/m.8227 type:complete len:245 (+) Transcript_4070:579-1313(+)